MSKLAALFVSALLFAFSAGAAGASPAKTITRSDLPVEARHTLELIARGGPFPHRQDGVVFGNRERLLPAQARGYYREYTVTTPGSRDRGARRIVAGSGKAGDVRTSGEYWYSDDHYGSFSRVVDVKGK
jgi:ribonuclease T1